MQNLPVLFALDRAGLVGEDRETHHGVFDISYLRHMPNLSILCPRDENYLQHALVTGLQHDGRWQFVTRGVKDWGQLWKHRVLYRGDAVSCCAGDVISILAVGTMVAPALAAAATRERKVYLPP